MPPSVASLDERINDIAKDVSELRSQGAAASAKWDLLATQLATVVNGLATSQAQQAALQAQLAASNARLDTAIEAIKVAQVRADAVAAKLDALATDQAAFRGESKAVFAIARWVGVSAFAAVLLVIGGAFGVARSAGHLDGTVQEHTKLLDEIKRDVTDIRSRLRQ